MIISGSDKKLSHTLIKLIIIYYSLNYDIHLEPCADRVRPGRG